MTRAGTRLWASKYFGLEVWCDCSPFTIGQLILAKISGSFDFYSIRGRKLESVAVTTRFISTPSSVRLKSGCPVYPIDHGCPVKS